MNRIHYIDTMRGIAILLVVLQHSIGTFEDSLSVLILSFHMPLFFFISGMCYKPRNNNEFIKKHIRRLLIPQFFMGIYLVALAFVKCFLIEEGKTYHNIDYQGLLIGWFLPVLFAIEMIAFYIDSEFKNRAHLLLILILTSVLFYFCEIQSFVYLQQVLAGFVFFIFGFLLRPALDKLESRKCHACVFMLIPVVAILSTYNMPIGMYINQYGNKILFVIVAMLGIVCTAMLSYTMKNDNLLEWFGRKSLQVYVLHWGPVKLFHRLTLSIIGNPHEYPNYLFIFLLTIMVIVPVVIFCDKYMPFIFGQFRCHRAS